VGGGNDSKNGRSERKSGDTQDGDEMGRTLSGSPVRKKVETLKNTLSSMPKCRGEKNAMERKPGFHFENLVGRPVALRRGSGWIYLRRRTGTFYQPCPQRGEGGKMVVLDCGKKNGGLEAH